MRKKSVALSAANNERMYEAVKVVYSAFSFPRFVG